MACKALFIHKVALLFIILLSIILPPKALAARAMSLDKRQDAEQSLDNYIKYTLGLHHVVISFDKHTAAIAANLDDTDPTAIAGKIGLLLTVAGAAAPWTQEVHFTLYSGQSLLTYVKVPTRVVLDYINDSIDDGQYFASWKFKGIPVQSPSPTASPDQVAIPVRKDTAGAADRLVPMADAYVYSYYYRNWNRANLGRYDQLRAGWHPTGGENRAYIRFDLASLQSVNSAVLRLFHFQTAGMADVDLGIYLVTSPWNEGSGTYHSGSSEETAGPGEVSWVRQPTFDPTPIATFNPGTGAHDFTTVDITQLVGKWLSGTPNYGLVIRPLDPLTTATPEAVYYFASRERKPDVDSPMGEQKAPVLMLSGAGFATQPQDTASLDTHRNSP